MFCPMEFRVDDLLSEGLSQNELQQSHSCLTVRGQRIFLDVYTDLILHVLDQAVKPLQKHGSTLHATLEMFLDVSCVKR